MAVSSRGVIATASDGRTVKLWNGATGQQLMALDHGSAVASLAFDTAGKRLASGGAGDPYHVVVWDSESGQRLSSYRGHNNTVQALAIAPNDLLAVSAGGNRDEIHVWHLASAKLALPALRGSGASVAAIAFSSIGDFLAWGYKDPCPEYWSCPNAQGVLEFQMRLPAPNSREGWTPFPEPFKANLKVSRTATRNGDRTIKHGSSSSERKPTDDDI